MKMTGGVPGDMMGGMPGDMMGGMPGHDGRCDGRYAW